MLPFGAPEGDILPFNFPSQVFLIRQVELVLGSKFLSLNSSDCLKNW